MLPAQQRALQIGLITFILSSLLCGFVLMNNAERGPLTFAWIGTRFSEGYPEGTKGYDGQFAYFIARDGAEAVPYIDGPTLRYQRILYPLVSRVLALGQAQLVPWTLLIVNLVAHSIAAGLVTYLLVGWGAPAIGGLIYGLWVGNLFAFLLDLNEPLCFVLALAAVIAYQQQRFRLTIVLLILSTLAKELGLVVAGGLAFHAFFNQRRGWSILIAGGPLLMLLTWWGVMRLWLGAFPTRYPAARTSLIPLQGMFAAHSLVELSMLAVWLGIPTVVFTLLALRVIWRTRQVSLSAALTIAGAGFVMIMPPVSWEDPVAAYRVALPIVIGGLLFIGQHYPRRMIWLVVLWLTALMLVPLLPQV